MAGNRRGMTLAEVVVASAILSIVVLGAVGSFRFITVAIRQSRTRTIANNIVAEKMEVLKNKSYFQLLVTSVTTNNTEYGVVYDAGAYPAEAINLWGYPAFTRGVHVAYAEFSGGAISTVSYTSNDTGLKQIVTYLLWTENDVKKKIEIRNLLANPQAASLNSFIQGTITDATSAAALASVKVAVVGNANWNGTTDATGFYSFSVSKGTYTVTASSAGYYSQTKTGIVAHRATGGTANFTLLKIASGTIAGEVWISSNILISGIIASSGTIWTCEAGAACQQEAIELFNPTTYTWSITSTNTVLEYKYQTGAGTFVTMDLIIRTSSIAPWGYYLIASTSPIMIGGVSIGADAVYDPADPDLAGVNDRDLIGGPYEGGIGIRFPGGRYYDRLGWGDGTASDDPPTQLTEGTAYEPAPGYGGLDDGEAFYRYTSTAALAGTTLGPAYDTDRNNVNFGWTVLVPAGYPRNSNSAVTRPVVGTPAHGAVITASDGLSVATQTVAANVGTNAEVARFSMVGIATGTWTVTVTSGAYKLDISTVVITQNNRTNIPNATTVSTWPGTNYHEAILTSTASGGFIQGYVYGAGDAASTPLSSILMEVNGATTRSGSNGYYLLNTTTGSFTVSANFNTDNGNYGTDSKNGTLTSQGQIVTLGNFNLPQSGTIKGYVTSGTGAFPNIIVRATAGSTVKESPSDNTGYFYITASTDSTSYTITAVLDPAQTFTTLPADPLTVTLTVPGSTVFAGTITVTGGLGTITGKVTEGGSDITTGVLIIASRGTIADPPALIAGSSAPALSNPFYAASSAPDGTYSLEVRATSYNMSAYYPSVNPDTGAVTYPRRTRIGVTVTAGATLSGQDFTW